MFELPGQTKQTRSKAVKNLRQHACSGLVKMCTKYLDLIFVSTVDSRYLDFGYLE